MALTNEQKELLVHHGIKGQQWGVKNGPPYPLDKATKKGIVKRAKSANKIRDPRERYKARNEFVKTNTDDDKAIISKASSDLQEIISEYKEFDSESKQLYDGYEKDRKSWAIKAAVKNAMNQPYDLDPYEVLETITGYVYDGLDDGYGNSVSTYLVNTGQTEKASAIVDKYANDLTDDLFYRWVRSTFSDVKSDVGENILISDKIVDSIFDGHNPETKFYRINHGSVYTDGLEKLTPKENDVADAYIKVLSNRNSKSDIGPVFDYFESNPDLTTDDFVKLVKNNKLHL